ncbi:MAG: hypothetical protein RIG84_00765 [Roseovarius sp.]
MSTLNLVSLVVMGALFALWVVMMATTLFTITRRSMDRLNETGGGYFTWAGHSLSAFGAFLSAREYKRERRRLLLVTALLFASIVARPMLMVATAGP